MKPASARRISSHADGPDVARARGRPATSASKPISSARSVPRRGKAPGWSCPGATPRHGGAPHRDQCRRRSRRPCGADRRSGRLALDAQAGDPRQHHGTVLALPPLIARVEPGGECLAIHARNHNWLSNRIFKSYETWSRCAAKPGTIIDQPSKIMSLGNAQSAWVLHDPLVSAAHCCASLEYSPRNVGKRSFFRWCCSRTCGVSVMPAPASSGSYSSRAWWSRPVLWAGRGRYRDRAVAGASRSGKAPDA